MLHNTSLQYFDLYNIFSKDIFLDHKCIKMNKAKSFLLINKKTSVTRFTVKSVNFRYITVRRLNDAMMDPLSLGPMFTYIKWLVSHLTLALQEWPFVHIPSHYQYYVCLTSCLTLICATSSIYFISSRSYFRLNSPLHC